MLSRIRRSHESNDEGFTLIELLTVILIISILAAIAIPIFLSQRQKAVESGMRSDLRSVANAMETYYVDAKVYPTFGTFTSGSVTVGSGAQAETVSLSDGNEVQTVTGTGVATGTFCLQIQHAKLGLTGAKSYYYDSDHGGVQDQGAG